MDLRFDKSFDVRDRFHYCIGSNKVNYRFNMNKFI